MRAKDLTGQKFGRLTAKYLVYGRRNGVSVRYWVCQCECGNEVVVGQGNLISGNTSSCGCYRKELLHEISTKHGGARVNKKDRLYAVWSKMRDRCNNPNNQRYELYGGRGITVCDEWNDYSKFREWAYENGYDENAKRDECMIDRIDNYAGYSPSNCRWVDISIQATNKRDTIYVNMNGERKPLSQVARELNLTYPTLYNRLKKGKTVEGIEGGMYRVNRD